MIHQFLFYVAVLPAVTVTLTVEAHGPTEAVNRANASRVPCMVPDAAGGSTELLPNFTHDDIVRISRPMGDNHFQIIYEREAEVSRT